MPNWCENRVDIFGDPDDIKAFRKEAIKDGKFQFANLIPRPAGLDIPSGYFGDSKKQKDMEKKQAENIKKYRHKDWYDWNCANWGTKWDVEATEGNPDDDELVQLNFDTAWSPAEEVCSHIRDKFPNLDVTWFYDEPGMAFAGYL